VILEYKPNPNLKNFYGDLDTVVSFVQQHPSRRDSPALKLLAGYFATDAQGLGFPDDSC